MLNYSRCTPIFHNRVTYSLAIVFISLFPNFPSNFRTHSMLAATVFVHGTANNI